MTVVVWVCGVLLFLGAAFAIVRLEKGPSMLDRTVALDIVVLTVIAALGLYAAVYRRADVVPILVVLSLVGFVGSVTIARFAAVEPEGEGRVLTREEIAAREAAQRAKEEASAGPSVADQASDETVDEQAAGEQAADEQTVTEQAAADERAAAPAPGREAADEHDLGGAPGEVR